jgi:hypothetical protein
MVRIGHLVHSLPAVAAGIATAIAAVASHQPPAGPGVAPALQFGEIFRDSTMRVDYYHTRGPGGETFAVDRIVSDGRWAGSRRVLLDSLDLGTYRFTVVDSTSGAPLYSRGFSSLYAEWETTGPRAPDTFHESLRFPWPRRTVEVVLERRDRTNAWVRVWSTFVDPAGPLANPAEPFPAGRVWTVFENGPPADKVDLVLVSEGYTRAELPRFHADVRRLVGVLFRTEPFKSRRRDFNVRAVDIPSPRSGVNRPHAGHFRRTPLSLSYGIFGLDRYMLTEANAALRDALSGVPYEFVEILANESQYGGGGILNFHAATAAQAALSDYVFVHEFGHHFAGLGDEYYTSPVAYETGKGEQVEPWEPNITALHDPAALKWRDLVEAGTPLPTPWPKDAYERYGREAQAARAALIAEGRGERVLDSLSRAQRDRARELLHGAAYSGKVGAFEGASYEATGLYRPQVDCIMFTRSRDFCRVCGRAIERVIGQYAVGGRSEE